MTTTPCQVCGEPTVARSVWNRLPKPRAARRRDRTGTCKRCAERARGNGRTIQPGPTVLAEWRWMHEVGELDPHDSRKRRIRYAAPRLGMSEAALERAILRANRRTAA